MLPEERTVSEQRRYSTGDVQEEEGRWQVKLRQPHHGANVVRRSAVRRAREEIAPSTVDNRSQERVWSTGWLTEQKAGSEAGTLERTEGRHRWIQGKRTLPSGASLHKAQCGVRAMEGPARGIRYADRTLSNRGKTDKRLG
ncbi:hypothetical protein CSOJ01_04222 [Colletotrichum sojae]|uniref:Uncharacterized protein n=1 Tax=Colletotrichum sojae TaxID=2175907 RepID=A0A8H6JJW9_9PEZI|nr:hypothetical protein CSOJ01_04222 [Colletotrichum sojae]